MKNISQVVYGSSLVYKVVFTHPKNTKSLSLPHAMAIWKEISNRKGWIRHQCMKATVLNCHKCLINTGVEKIELHLNIFNNFEQQMSLSKSKCLYSYNCLHFLKCAVPLTYRCWAIWSLHAIGHNILDTNAGKQLS